MADADPFAQYVTPEPKAAGDDPFAQYVAPESPPAAPAAPSRLERARTALGSVGGALAQPFVDIGHGLMSANRAVAGAISHPVDTFNAIRANPGAYGREAMRGVNDNIPFANRAVAAMGGPAAESPEDAEAAPGARAVGGVAGLPAASMVGGIAGKAIETAAPVVAKVVKGIGESAQERQVARAKEALEMKVNKGTRAGIRSDVVDSAIADSPALRAAAGDDAKVSKVTTAMRKQGQATLGPLYAKSGPADEAVAKAVSNTDARIAELAKGDVNQRAAAVKLQKLRDEFNDSFGGRETTTARQLRDEQSAYQKNGYAKNIAGDPDVSASILAQREMSKAVGDSLVEHVTGMGYEQAKAAAQADPNSIAAKLFKANDQITVANKVEAGIADRAGRVKPKEGLLKTAAEIKHSPTGYALSKVPEAADAAGRVVDNQLAKLAPARAAQGLPPPPGAPALPPAPPVQPNIPPGRAVAVARLLQMARAGATRAQLQAQAQQDGTPIELADNIAMQSGR